MVQHVVGSAEHAFSDTNARMIADTPRTPVVDGGSGT
jgi:hypothetical protein